MASKTTPQAAERLRFERGLTAAAVAQGAAIAPMTLRAIEEGREPSAPVAKKLADFYGVTVAELLGWQEAA
jgi:transcriptional regulator with XRE-family HTH domain